MRLEITRVEGARNDLIVRLDRAEIDAVRLSVAHRDALRRLPGVPRHRPATDAETRGFVDAKIPIEAHLAQLSLVDASGQATARTIAISNRNLGANHSHLAWQSEERPRIFRVLEDPADRPAYSCLAVWKDGDLSIEDLQFDVAADRVQAADGGADVSGDLVWATSGPRVLRGGRVSRIDDIIDEFYDLRHVLAFDPHRPEGERIRADVYQGYPRAFRAEALRAWRERGVPRARYVHNAIGLSAESLVIVQREGTIEEIGGALAEAGADEGLILDNGGSVACWAWWVNNYRGGLVSPTVDFRPPGTSAIAFVLRGPRLIDLPGGSVAYSVA